MGLSFVRVRLGTPETHPQGVGVTYANVYMLDNSVPKNDWIESMLDVYRY